MVLSMVPSNAQYRPLGSIDKKRLVARKNNTTYCYDFPLAFETALRWSWASYASAGTRMNDNNDMFKFTELMFADSHGAWGTPLVPVSQSSGLNDIGMVAWLMEMSTPEFCGGRKIVVVANDVT